MQQARNTLSGGLRPWRSADAEVRQLRATGKRIASCVALADAYELPFNRNHPE